MFRPAQIVVIPILAVGLLAHADTRHDVEDLATISIPTSATPSQRRYLLGNGEYRVEYSVGGALVGEREFYSKEQGNRIRMEWLYDADRKLHGVRRLYHANGQLFAEEPYRHAVPDGTFRFWDLNGKLLGESVLQNGNGILRRHQGINFGAYYDQELPYMNGQIHGVVRSYGRNGEYSLAEYQQDKADGWSLSYHANHTLRGSSRSKAGQTHGVTRTFDKDGRMIEASIRYFVKGEIVSKDEYLAAAKTDPWLNDSLNNDGRNVKLETPSIKTQSTSSQVSPPAKATVQEKNSDAGSQVPGTNAAKPHPASSATESAIQERVSPSATIPPEPLTPAEREHLAATRRWKMLRQYAPAVAVLAILVLGAMIWYGRKPKRTQCRSG